MKTPAPPCFDHFRLRRIAYIAWLAPLGWIALHFIGVWLDAAHEAPALAWLLNNALMPVWFILVCTGAYYFYLVLFRFRITLGPFMLLMLFWGNLTAATFAWAEWPAGVTVALGLGALICFALTWSQSVAGLCGYNCRVSLTSLFLLGLFLPLAILLVPASGFVLYLNSAPRDAVIYAVFIPTEVLSLLVITLAAVFHRRARRAARARLTPTAQ